MNSSALPRISLVTPSLNQGDFLEASIRSVLDQRYGNLEYIIIDGGSHDCSVDILRSYSESLSFWSTEPDGGIYDAINRGFSRATGSIMGWLGADDKLPPWTFDTISQIFQRLPQVQWLTSQYPMMWDPLGALVHMESREGYSKRAFLWGRNCPGLPWYGGTIQQESTFWTRKLWDQAGGFVSQDCGLAGDFDLWARFFAVDDLYSVDLPLGGGRRHTGSRSYQNWDRYMQESKKIWERYQGRQPPPTFQRMHAFLQKFRGFPFWNRLLPHLPWAFASPSVYWDIDDFEWKVRTQWFL